MSGKFWPPLIIAFIVFALAKAFAMFIALQGNCWSVWDFNCWGRWDSALYIDVAKQGHTLFYCGPEQGYTAISTTDWCGNAGWAPLYPALMRLVNQISGISFENAGIVISNFFFLAFLLAAAHLLEIKNLKIRNWMLMGIVAFCPGNIYFHAVFPLSTVAFLLTLFFIFLKKEKYLAAGITAFFAVLTYSIGFFLLGALGLFGLYLLFAQKKKFWKFTWQTGFPALLGVIALFAYDQYSTGHWNALFLIQTKYGHGLHSPLKMLGLRWTRMMDGEFALKTWIEIQNFIVVMYVVLMVVYILANKSMGIFRFFHAAFLFLFWFLPLSASLDVGLYRNAAVLGPGHSATKTLPTWLLGCILLIFLALSYPLGILFISSVLV